MLIVCLYVDDLLITGCNESEIVDFKHCMMAEFEMTDLGELSHFLGMEFVQTSKGIFMHQKKYASEILKKFNMQNCNSLTTPTETGLRLIRDGVDETMYRKMVGSLRFLCNTRPDLAYGVGLISRNMEKPKSSLCSSQMNN